MGKYIVEMSLIAIVGAWVIGNSSAFNKVATASSSAYVKSVQSLWYTGTTK